MNPIKPISHPKFLGALLSLALLTALPATQVFAGNPCCSIVKIDKATGVVTLRDNKTGKLETITVSDITIMKLNVGQAVDRSIGVPAKMP
jgi:hypothetical protein